MGIAHFVNVVTNYSKLYYNILYCLMFLLLFENSVHERKNCKLVTICITQRHVFLTRPPVHLFIG